ncbi:hypothetical protein STEG23_031333, partial [Scotinomys teguina]
GLHSCCLEPVTCCPILTTYNWHQKLGPTNIEYFVCVTLWKLVWLQRLVEETTAEILRQ